MREHDFECFANTGVNTPVAMSPNPECREVKLPRSGLGNKVWFARRWLEIVG